MNILKTIGFYIFALVIALSMVGLIIFGNSLVDPKAPRVYNCSVAEISPDFTNAMREECRKQRKVTL